MPTEPGIAQNERRGSGRDYEKLDLLLVVPDGHAVSGTEWGRLSWMWSREAKFWLIKFSAAPWSRRASRGELLVFQVKRYLKLEMGGV